jgi:hypothetical protein
MVFAPLAASAGPDSPAGPQAPAPASAKPHPQPAFQPPPAAAQPAIVPRRVRPLALELIEVPHAIGRGVEHGVLARDSSQGHLSIPQMLPEEKE